MINPNGNAETVDAIKKYAGMEKESSFPESDLSGYDSDKEDLEYRKVNALLREREAAADEHEAMAERAKDNNRLRKRVSTWLLVIVSAQLFLCNVGIIAYGIFTLASGRTIPHEVILGWLASCLVEVIGVLVVIVKSLFPPSRGEEKRDSR